MKDKYNIKFLNGEIVDERTLSAFLNLKIQKEMICVYDEELFVLL